MRCLQLLMVLLGLSVCRPADCGAAAWAGPDADPPKGEESDDDHDKGRGNDDHGGHKKGQNKGGSSGGGGGGGGATIYYVRLTGKDSNDGKSPDKAFRTIDKAADKVDEGDTVYVGAGTYDESVEVEKDGKSSAPIRFIADTSGAQTGDAGAVLIDGDKGEALEVKGDSVHFTGFAFTGGKGDGVYWNGCTGGRLEQCSIYGVKDDGLRIVEADLIVTECQISGNKDEGIEIGKKGSLTITDSSIYTNGGDGVKATDNNARLDLRGCSITGNDDRGVRMSRGQGVVVNCLIADNGKDGIRAEGSASTRIDLSNTTIVGNKSDGVEVTKARVSLTNCIVAANNSDGLDRNSGSMTLSHNIVWGNGDKNYEGVSAGSGDLSKDPMLSPAPDYRQTAGSPAIDSGTAITGVTTVDIEGSDRPAGAGWDRGCYEETGAGTGSRVYADVTGAAGFGATTASGSNPATVLFADLDNDGDLDAILTGDAGARRMLNTGGVFSGATLGSGDVVGQAGLFDADNDGDLDLWAARVAGDTGALLRNSGTASFTTHDAEGLGLGGPTDNDGLVLGDLDANGRCDVVMLSGNGNFVGLNVGAADAADPRRFTTSADDAMGLNTPFGSGDGHYAASADVNGDGEPDLLFQLGSGAMFLSTGDGAYTLAADGINLSGSGSTKVGLAWADYDNDGDLDCFAGNRAAASPALLFRNSGGSFSEVASAVGLGAAGDWISGAWGDYDNDGDLDLLLVAGDTGQSVLYANGGDGTFAATGEVFSAGVAGADAVFADYDNDGDLDLAFTHQGAAAALWQNSTDSGDYLKVRLVGSGARATNTAAVGTRVELYSGSTLLARRDIGAMRGYGGQEPLWAHFGVADPAQAYTVRVYFASGAVETAVTPSTVSTTIGTTTIAQMVTITEPDPAAMSVVEWTETDPSQ